MGFPKFVRGRIISQKLSGRSSSEEKHPGLFPFRKEKIVKGLRAKRKIIVSKYNNHPTQQAVSIRRKLREGNAEVRGKSREKRGNRKAKPSGQLPEEKDRMVGGRSRRTVCGLGEKQISYKVLTATLSALPKLELKQSNQRGSGEDITKKEEGGRTYRSSRRQKAKRNVSGGGGRLTAESDNEMKKERSFSAAIESRGRE